MKYVFLFISFLFFALTSNSQQLSIEYFENSCEKSTPHYNYELEKKGFQPDSDIVLNNYHKYSFLNKNKLEKIEWVSSTDKEGAKSITISYSLPLKSSYKNFKRSIKKYKYKRESSGLYKLTDGANSYRSISLNGKVIINDQKYYLITFTKFLGQELTKPEK